MRSVVICPGRITGIGGDGDLEILNVVVLSIFISIP